MQFRRNDVMKGMQVESRIQRSHAAALVVVFASIFTLFSSSGTGPLSPDDYLNGFIPIMCFSIAILAISFVCTVAVKNKVVRKED